MTRALEQRAQRGGRVDLAAMAAQRVDVADGTAPTSPCAASVDSAPVISADCAARWAAEQAGERQRGRDLRAVDQRQPFLGAEHDRRRARLRRAPPPPACARRWMKRFADADHHRRHMRQRREVAGGADRALFRDDRDDVLVRASPRSARASRAARRTRRAPSETSFSAIISRTMRPASGSPTPQQCDRIEVALQGFDIGGGDARRWRVCRSRC